MSEIPIEQCYQFLGLRRGASIEEINAAYGRQVSERMRSGDRADLPLLKAAYHRVQEDAAAIQAQQPAATATGPESEVAEWLLQHLNQPSLQIRVREQGPILQVMLLSNAAPAESLATHVFQSLKPLEASRGKTLKVYGMRGRAIAWKHQFQMPMVATMADRDPYAFNNRYTTALVFPIALILAWFTNLVPFFQFVFLPMQIWIHEFGHATVAWFFGRKATPLPFGWTNFGEERSLFVYFGILTLSGLLFWTGRKEGKRWVMGVAIAFAIIQFCMTWLLPERAFMLWMSFGGVGGEFYLSTLLMVCFYFPFPERWRWDFWRYFVMLTAANAFWRIFWFWQNVQQGAESIPWGTLFGGEGDTGGDMNRLSLDYNWTDQQIINTYNRLGGICLLVLIGVYVFFLLKQNPQIAPELRQKLKLWQVGRR